MSHRSRLATLVLLVGVLIVAGSLSLQAQSRATVHLTAPGTLSLSNTTYVLDNDVSAPGTAFTLGANGITLDLNGHTVTYNTAAGDDVYGVCAQWNKTGLRVTNGSIVQGAGNGYRSHAVYLREVTGIEVDRLRIAYQGDDTMGVYGRGSGIGTRDASVHDNIIRPNGTKRVLSHYGDFAAILISGTGGDIDITNNDLQGTGYQGIFFGYSVALSHTLEITDNTVMMSSPVGDGYAVVIYSANNDDIGFEVARNTIVQNGRGIIVEGSTSDASPGPGSGTIHDNYIESRESRTPDPAGPGLSTGICVRFGAHNISIYRNTVKVFAGQTAAPGPFATNLGSDCNARGLKVHSGVYGRDIEVYDNTIVATTEDTSHYASAIYAINAGAAGTNVVFHDNLVLSNSLLVDLNSNDGGASYQLFRSNRLVKAPDPQAFHAIRAGYWTGQAIENTFLDNSWQAGASGDDVLLSTSGGAPYSLTTQGYLYLTVKSPSGAAVPGAGVSATATGGAAETVSGTTDASGHVQLVLTDYARSGVTYPPTSNYTHYTPHLVAVSAAGYPTETKTFTMTSSQEATVILDGSSAEPPIISSVAVTDLTGDSATVTWTTDRAADSQVQYGTSTGYGTTRTDAVQVTNHRVTLTGLSLSTYHFRVTSTDANGLGTQGVDHTFTILPTSPHQRSLLLTKSADRTAPRPGDVVTYAISYSNGSQSTLRGAQIVDTVPANVTYVPNSASSGGTYDGTRITWSLGDLAPGASGTVTFQVTVN